MATLPPERMSILAVVKPFRALRYSAAAGDLAQLVSPPYDIISESERAGYLRTNPRNIVQLELPRDGTDPYMVAGQTLQAWLQNGTLVRNAQEELCFYEEEFTVAGETKTIRGLTCRVRLEELANEVVLPHEFTLSKAKTDRFQLMCATRCNISAIYSLYFDPERVVTRRMDRLAVREPDEQFTTGDGIIHRVWHLYDAREIAAITAAFADKKLYIADGHHRYETALNYRRHLIEQGEQVDDSHPANYMMMTLVDMENPGLVVFPTHRIVHHLASFSMDDLLAKCSPYFALRDTTPAAAVADLSACYERGEKALAVYDGMQTKLMVFAGSGIMAEVLPGATAASQGLDVNLLHLLILERILGIDAENLRNQTNLTYTRSEQEAFSAVDSGAANCCFLLNPTRVEEIAQVAGAGEKMPQKSTYFYPKMITGYVMNPLFD